MAGSAAKSPCGQCCYGAMSGFSSRNDAREKRMRNSRHSWLGYGTESAPSVRRPADDLPDSQQLAGILWQPDHPKGRRRSL